MCEVFGLFTHLMGENDIMGLLPIIPATMRVLSLFPFASFTDSGLLSNDVCAIINKLDE